MSWDSYIDNLIAQTKDSAGTAHCDKACIIGLDGGAPWTTPGHGCAIQVMTWSSIVALCWFQSMHFCFIYGIYSLFILLYEIRFQFGGGSGIW